jgi:hypothetical protein
VVKHKQEEEAWEEEMNLVTGGRLQGISEVDHGSEVMDHGSTMRW